MAVSSSFFHLASLALSGALVAAAPLAPAAVLDFSGNICSNSSGGACNDGALISSDYGDIAGVLDVQYRNLSGNPTLTELRYWRNDYSDLVDVAWTDGGDAVSRAEIFLKPLDGSLITLNGFDLGAWPDSQITTSFSILDGNGTLLTDSGGIITVGIQPGNFHSSFKFSGISSASGIRIQWGPSAYNVGIDNIDFTVSAVPLPEPVGLLGSAMVALAARRRGLRD